MVITDELIRRHPSRSEGWLSRARSDLVRAGTLHAVALELGVGPVLRLGRGEELTGGREKPSILADTVEALIGAVYLDGGMDAARAVIIAHFGSRLDGLNGHDEDTGSTAPADAKSRLQERCARGGGIIPTYSWREAGPEHDKTFTVQVHLDGRVLGVGVGRSKKQAEQDAAAQALAVLETTSDQPTHEVPSG